MNQFIISVLLFGAASVAAWGSEVPLPWRNDFQFQPTAQRPRLEVRYTDSTRTAFEILGANYHLRGDLRAPHGLRDASTGELWLGLAVTDAQGATFEAGQARAASRINLYRRGPYYCEIHWLDLTVADAGGATLPLKGDLALYCYPDQVLGSITWHATGDLGATAVRVRGRQPREFGPTRFASGQTHRFAFSLHGVREPLPDRALETLSAVAPLQYDALRGCYTIGSRSLGGFEAQFYDHPNDYEKVSMRVINEAAARTIYICHRTTEGDRGQVEGGVLLDADQHPLPITVQISKNFAGEREEKFYNPSDEPFSETWFPLFLGAGERCEVTSLHLYQNWGRHMVKQFSSLGAWMDYFHSSSGVTETTCYVPFKFGGLPGIDIADFRAMSQTTFWASQPQHDNVGGHSFLSYHDGARWQYLEYRGTTYTSTGPNWMDITFNYLSTDGKVRAAVRTFELPQKDELRNFIRVRYEVLAPLTIRNAPEQFRLVSASSQVQRLRYTHFAASGGPVRELEFARNHTAVRGQPLPRRDGFAALFGEKKGSNAILLRSWSAGFDPAVTVHCETNLNTRLSLVPAMETLNLRAGDVIEFDAVFMPYGEVDGLETCRREIVAYGSEAPRLAKVSRGQGRADFPTVIAARKDRAEFVLQGGRDLVPVIVTGLEDYRWPVLYRKDREGWQPLPLARADDRDGVQVFCEPEGRFGAVMLLEGSLDPQTLRFENRPLRPAPRRIVLRAGAVPAADSRPVLQLSAPEDGESFSLAYPAGFSLRVAGQASRGAESGASEVSAGRDVIMWSTNVGNSFCYEARRPEGILGGRVTPNEKDVDLEFWVRNSLDQTLQATTWFEAVLEGSPYDDPRRERSWVLVGGEWRRWRSVLPDSKGELKVEAWLIDSGAGRRLAFAWPAMRLKMGSEASARIRFAPSWPDCPPGRRAYHRGKIYWSRQTLEELRRQIK